MVYCVGQQCTFEIACPNADEVRVCGDCLPSCCSMQRRAGNAWFALIVLPPGRHTIHYLARFGARTICIGQEQVEVGEPEVGVM